MSEAMEHHEHAEHAAHGGNRRTALLIAALAATLAVCEQGAKHAEIRAQQGALTAADIWAQYQAKSIRAAVARDLGDAIATLDPPAQVALIQRRDALVARLAEDARRYETEPHDGKEALAGRARAAEAGRDDALERTHAYHNASAMAQLAIVLATASVIVRSRWLEGAALALGALGAVVGVLGFVAPSWGAF